VVPAAELLPEAELEVLACLHEHGPAEATAVRAALRRFRPLSHASVVTLLLRLQAKGFVSRRKADAGKAYVYAATRSAGSTQRRVLGRLLQRVFGNDPVSLVSSLLAARSPTAAEVAALRRLVDDLEKPS
jgi:predicted transcriptional regulator